MRLIDADANVETMKKCVANPENEQALLCYRFAQRILEEAPTVDAVQVVRCDDCRWYDKSTVSGTYEPIAYKCKLHHRFTLGNMFCSDGEKDDA